MQYSMTGRNLKTIAGMKDIVEHRLTFLESYLKEGSVVSVSVNIVSDTEQKVEILFTMNGEFIKAEAIAQDFHSALDHVANIVEKQVMKKNRA